MSGYLRSTPFETQFDGDTVKARLKPLLYEDFIRITSAETENDAIQLFQKILPTYVEEFTGLRDQAGSEVGLGEVCSQLYFIGLVGQIGAKLIESSSVPQKPAAQSAS